MVGYASCHLNDRFGRKKMLVIFLVVSSLVCLVVAVLPSESESLAIMILKMAFVFFGKASASAAFNSAYIYNSLLYSTAVRSTIVLFASNFGNLGGFISPQINSLQTLIWRPLPYLIFSVSSLIASLCVSVLPDPEKIKFI
jgi:OCT family organic cation transporter-like MFS transporter 16